MLYTTLQKIRAHRPCAQDLSRLTKRLGISIDDKSDLAMDEILAAVGLIGAVWTLRTVDGHEIAKRKYAVFCASMLDWRASDEAAKIVIDTAGNFAKGLATEHDLTLAYRQAYKCGVTYRPAYACAYACANRSIYESAYWTLEQAPDYKKYRIKKAMVKRFNNDFL